ncbi:hypothetical protein [Photobacterium phosphoreum]|uniref:hypothetical protein n=1 Tax=Photobacterium phosphoreum TaxID=659 RepID=UPI0024BA605B|nr:hypothetical protein [Photobacterium phosphoreum]
MKVVILKIKDIVNVNIIKKFLSFTLPVKIIIGFMVSALTSASVIGLCNEFAVYNYALTTGFRAPVEGIPYLRTTVILISFILFIVTVFLFFLIMFIVVFIRNILYFLFYLVSVILSIFNIKYDKNRHLHLPAMLSLKNSTILSIVSSLFITYSSSYLYYFDIQIITEKYQYFIIFITSFVAYFSIFKPTYIIHLSVLISLFFIVFTFTLMFNNELYSKFLYNTGFGGGKDIILYTNDFSGNVSGKLLIQSNDYYILLLPDLNVIEYPVKNVDRIKYKISPIY